MVHAFSCLYFALPHLWQATFAPPLPSLPVSPLHVFLGHLTSPQFGHLKYDIVNPPHLTHLTAIT